MIGMAAGTLALALAAFFVRRTAVRRRRARVRKVRAAAPRAAYTRARPWPANGAPPAAGGAYRRPLEIHPQDGAPMPDRPLRDRYDE
jgi:hypothetical protein